MIKYGSIMSADTEVAKIEDGHIIPVNKALMPLYLQRNDNPEGWLESRAIDRRRINARLLKKALRLTAESDVDIVLKVHAATITDNYWVKETESNLCYDDVKFKSNIYDKLALYGDPDSFSFGYAPTPELTNIGSFEKCWHIADGKWWLFKQGNNNERFSELFIYLLGKRLGFNMAHYETDGSYIKSLDFTNDADVNYEPMHSLVAGDNSYEKSFSVLYELCPDAARDYVFMIYLDTICSNLDRHTFNYGVLRNTVTGDVLGLAPNFDNNITLISRGFPENLLYRKHTLINLFIRFISNNELARRYYEEIDQSVITKDLIDELIADTGFEVDRQKVIDFVLSVTSVLQNTTLYQEELYEYGLPKYLQDDLDRYKEGLKNGSSLMDCYWCELYGSVNGAEIDDRAITHEHAEYLRDKYLR